MVGQCSECGVFFGSAEEFSAHLEPDVRHNQYSANRERVCSVAGAAIFVSRNLAALPSTLSESSGDESLSLSVTEEQSDSGSDSHLVTWFDLTSKTQNQEGAAEL